MNADLSQDRELANSQIHRFLILHKELDADDGELTRTRKVRRGHIGEKYGTLVDALYGGKQLVHVEAQVRYEDGRTGIDFRGPEDPRREDLSRRRGKEGGLMARKRARNASAR